MNAAPLRASAPAAMDRRLGLQDRLGLIALIDEGLRSGSPRAPMPADLFSNLWELVEATVSGSRISRLKPETTGNGFQVFEITAETGESLGRLHMLYLKKPLPCYYLVYVEVAPPFRRKGLGTRILEHFREFLAEKGAVGILDNIIPPDDPTFDIYQKQAWEPIEALVGDTLSEPGDHYMVYVPPVLRRRDLREPLIRLLYHLKRRRTAIDMRENELMVQRTIGEFKDLYTALRTYFEDDIRRQRATPMMRFMFTRFVTKLVGFRRRIADLVGYTGGDSLAQIPLDPYIAAVPVQSYAPMEPPGSPACLWDAGGLWPLLPAPIREHPARAIEALPNYRRPSWTTWLQTSGRNPGDPLTLGDLMDLGFDPTRLKEIRLQGRPYIFERIQARRVGHVERIRQALGMLKTRLAGSRARNALLQVTPPLLALRDRGNAYILRRKIPGIHWEEALEQIRCAPDLSRIHRELRLEPLIHATVGAALRLAASRAPGIEALAEDLTLFVSWDLDRNRPQVQVDAAGVFLQAVWLA